MARGGLKRTMTDHLRHTCIILAIAGLTLLAAAPSHAEIVARKDVGPWLVACTKDSMSDDLGCMLTTSNGKGTILVVGPAGSHVPRLSVHNRVVRSGSMLIRVGEAQPQPFKCCVIEGDAAAKLIAALQDNNQLRLRLMPDRGESIDATLPVDRLGEALQERRAMCQRLKTRC